jgi:hypothetical protein
VSLRLPQPIAPLHSWIMEPSRIAKIDVETADRTLFILVDGVRVARRGYMGSPQAGTWVSIEPGWEAMDSDEGVIVRHNGVWVHS